MCEKERCITLYNDDMELARKRRPQGYHIEYTRNGFPLYILEVIITILKVICVLETRSKYIVREHFG